MTLRLAALLSVLFLAPALNGQELAPAPTPASEIPDYTLDYGYDRSDRMTVPVSVEGKGPYQFIVDTGAERTVIARELADELDLGLGMKARLHSMTEVSSIQTVIINALEVGGKSVRDIHAPALERRNIGAEGILGVDSLQSKRVSFDFARQQMTVTPSKKRERAWPADTIVVTARNRFGYLVLIDASIDGQKVWVILDTGAQTTVANSALRRKLEKRGRIGKTWPIQMLSVTGGRLTADQTVMKEIRLGGINIRNLAVAFSDVHPFRKLDLMDRPAILLGMDALRLFERVSVDFTNREVRLLPSSDTLGVRPERFALKEWSLPDG
jgi:predicted aspartyl protease